MSACAPGRCGRGQSTIGPNQLSGLRITRRRRCAATCGGRSGLLLAAGGGYLTLLTYFTGWQGLLLYFVSPWFAIHAWFSITTLMHHSSEDIPYLPEHYWTRNASRLLVTTDYVYPRWLLFLTHNISLHTAHHVSPAVPFYNLDKAQVALKQAYPGMVRVERASAARVWTILRKCRFYDPISGLYSTRRLQRADSVQAGPT